MPRNLGSFFSWSMVLHPDPPSRGREEGIFPGSGPKPWFRKVDRFWSPSPKRWKPVRSQYPLRDTLKVCPQRPQRAGLDETLRDMNGGPFVWSSETTLCRNIGASSKHTLHSRIFGPKTAFPGMPPRCLEGCIRSGQRGPMDANRSRQFPIISSTYIKIVKVLQRNCNILPNC